MPEQSIPETWIRRQAIKYYLILFLWPLYLFFLPLIFDRFGAWGILYMVFPGVYLFTWVGFLMHESWHKYVPNISNGFFYNAFALMLLTDPQLYRVSHGYHHSQVHTYEDAEFHPIGRIGSRFLRILYNWGEVLLGVVFLVGMASLAIPRDPRFKGRYKLWKLALSSVVWVAFLGGIAALAHWAFGIGWISIAGPIFLSLWLNSVLLHQSQLIEHGNLFVDGSFPERNIWTRNLKPATPMERVILFFTHGDSREHVLHHTLTTVYSRPFPGRVPMPENAVYITLGGYLRGLGRMLAGKEDMIQASSAPPAADGGR